MSGCRGAPGCCTGLTGLPQDLQGVRETAPLDICWTLRKLKVVSVSTLGHTAFLWIVSLLLKAGFLVVAVIKSKYYAKINVEQKTRVVVSNLTLRVWNVVENPTDTHIPLVSNYGYLRMK